MGLLDFLKASRIPNVEVVNTNTEYDTSNVGSFQIPDSLTTQNAFTLANTVSEINFPIDFLADRASKLRFYIEDKKGNEVINTELNRFIRDINPLYSFSDLVYQYVFSYLSDGNAISYIGIPTLYSDKVTVNNITRLDILQPDLILIEEYFNINSLTSISINDYIRRARYSQTGGMYADLTTALVRINGIDSTRRESSQILCKTPLFKSVRNINNLLAVYSARYNVYANNGSAGLLVRKTTNIGGIEEAINPIDRQKILDDINARNGITGRKNFWGISGVPVEFINTLANIKDLMPFEETLEDSIKIASIYQIPPTLVPRKDQSTFDNQDAADKSVWENALMSIVDTTCLNFTKIFTLDKTSYSIKADYSTVSALKQNDKVIAETSKLEQEAIKLKIDNLNLLKLNFPEKVTEINTQIEKILLEYGKE